MRLKRAVQILEDLSEKMGRAPYYECKFDMGPRHKRFYKYKCEANGIVTTAEGRYKNRTKLHVVSAMLQQLAAKGISVPSPYGQPLKRRNNISFLRNLCLKLILPPPVFEVVFVDSSLYTVKASSAGQECLGRSSTVRGAKQLAALKLIPYLKDNFEVIKNTNESYFNSLYPTFEVRCW